VASEAERVPARRDTRTDQVATTTTEPVLMPTFDDLRLEHGLSAVDQTDAQDGSQRNL